jgi:hypothetical protein
VKQVIIFISFIAVLFSCRKESLKPEWDADFLTPLVSSRITLDQLIPDSLMEYDSDGNCYFVYESMLGEIYLDSLLKIPDTTISYTASLNNLNINDIIFDYSVSLGDIAREDSTQNGASSNLYNTIMTAHNLGTPAHIDPISPMIFDDVAIDASDYFQTVTLEDGVLEITINNQLPIMLTNAVYEIKNTGSGQIIVKDSFPVINPGAAATHSHSLAGLMLENQLSGYVSIASPGSAGDVVIDTSYAVHAHIAIRDIKILSATARFPAQEILMLNECAEFANNDIQITQAIVKEGSTQITLSNTLDIPIHYSFELPGVRLNTVPLAITGTLPAGTIASPSQVNIVRDLSNYIIDFTGIRPFELISGDLNGNGIVDPPADNSLYYKLSGSIDSTGNFINLSQQDFVSAECSFSGVKPAYIKGYFGNTTGDTSGVISFNLLPELQVSTASFENARFFLTVENEIGATARMNINNLRAINTVSGFSSQLTGAALQNPFILTSPADPNSITTPVNPTTNVLYLDNQNSNIHQLVSVLPNMLEYDFGFELNPGMTPPAPNTGNNFVYSNAHLTCYLNTEIPLNLSFDNLNADDTVQADMSGLNANNINYGSLILYSYNYFPFRAQVNLFFIDSNGQNIDSLSYTPLAVNAGNPSPSGKVLIPTLTKSVVPFTAGRLENLKRTRSIRVKGTFSSQPASQHVRIYSSYFIEFRLVGDFNYHIKP